MEHATSTEKTGLVISMSTYVLIHGAWHARWAWDEVIPLFSTQDTIIPLDLPGHGDHKASFHNINMKTYVDYVISQVQLVREPVILVGHSMAGMMISQVAEEIPESIERLSYVAAFVPRGSETVLDIAQKFNHTGVSTEMIWDKAERRIHLKQSSFLVEVFYNACPKVSADKAMQALQPEPMQPCLDSVKLTPEKFGSVKKQCIECWKDNTISIEDQRAMQNKITCFVTPLSDADHSPFYSTPLAFVQALRVKG